MENDTAVDIIREDPEFEQVSEELKAKYYAEHERVRQWLEENDHV